MDEPPRPQDDSRDNKRAFRWGAMAVILLIVLVLGYNLVSYERAGPLGPGTNTEQATPKPAPSEGGSAGGAGPGTGAGSGTGAGTGAPRP